VTSKSRPGDTAAGRQRRHQYSFGRRQRSCEEFCCPDKVGFWTTSTECFSFLDAY